MTTKTTRFDLTKPALADPVDPVEQIANNMQKIDDKAALVGHAHTGQAGDGPQIQASGLADNAVTDAKIGDRTPDQTQVPASPGKGKLADLLSWIVNRIKAITGATNWWDAPATTLAAADSHAKSKTGHVPNGKYVAFTSGADQAPAWGDISGKPTTFAPASHALTHRAGGSDPITPADIGAIAKGVSNQSVEQVLSLLVAIDTRSSVLTYTGGQLTKVEVKDGATVVKTTVLTYSSGRLYRVAETAKGQTVTRQLNYNPDGSLASVTPV